MNLLKLLFDVLRMMRQKVFINLAIKKAVEILQKNVFAGELYDGQLLETLSKLDVEFFELYLEEIKSIVKCELRNQHS